MDLREMYISGFEKFTLNPGLFKLLKKVISGDEQNTDYEEILEQDSFFSKVILSESYKLTHNEPLRNLSHGVSLLGKEKVRKFIFAHSICRLFDPKADVNFKTIAQSASTLKRSIEAENLTKQFTSEKPELGFCCGIIFDIFEAWLSSDSDLKKSYSAFFTETWQHSLRAALIAATLTQRLRAKITNSRLVFSASLLHDIGRLMLALCEPESYPRLIIDFNNMQKKTPHSDNYLEYLEQYEFGFTHSSIGSLLIWQFEPLREVEAFVEYHHSIDLIGLRYKNQNANSLVISLSDKIAHLIESNAILDSGSATLICGQYESDGLIQASDLVKTVEQIRTKTALV